MITSYFLNLEIIATLLQLNSKAVQANNLYLQCWYRLKNDCNITPETLEFDSLKINKQS